MIIEMIKDSETLKSIFHNRMACTFSSGMECTVVGLLYFKYFKFWWGTGWVKPAWFLWGVVYFFSHITVCVTFPEANSTTRLSIFSSGLLKISPFSYNKWWKFHLCKFDLFIFLQIVLWELDSLNLPHPSNLAPVNLVPGSIFFAALKAFNLGHQALQIHPPLSVWVRPREVCIFCDTPAIFPTGRSGTSVSLQPPPPRGGGSLYFVKPSSHFNKLTTIQVVRRGVSHEICVGIAANFQVSKSQVKSPQNNAAPGKEFYFCDEVEHPTFSIEFGMYKISVDLMMYDQLGGANFSLANRVSKVH